MRVLGREHRAPGQPDRRGRHDGVILDKYGFAGTGKRGGRLPMAVRVVQSRPWKRRDSPSKIVDSATNSDYIL